MEKYPFHKYADLFPMITEPEAWKTFVDDIRENGVREPAVLYQDAVLDGRNRHNAAFEAGVDLPTVTFEGDDNAAIDLVVSRNIRRRHLTPSQCSAIAVDLANMKLGDNQHTKNEGIPIGTPSPTSLSEAVGKVPGASHGTAKRLAGVKKEDPGAFDKVKSGELSAGAAEQKVKTAKERRIDEQVALAYMLRKARTEQPNEEAFFAFAKTLPGKPSKAECTALVNLGGLDDGALRALLARYGGSMPFAEIWRDYQQKSKQRQGNKSKKSGDKGDKVQTTVNPSLTQEEKDKRSFTLFNAKGAWSYAFSVFAEASLNAKKRIVARLATDLGAKIIFANESFEPEKVSLNQPDREGAVH
jgi:hypothetical protein